MEIKIFLILYDSKELEIGDFMPNNKIFCFINYRLKGKFSTLLLILRLQELN